MRKWLPSLHQWRCCTALLPLIVAALLGIQCSRRLHVFTRNQSNGVGMDGVVVLDGGQAREQQQFQLRRYLTDAATTTTTTRTRWLDPKTVILKNHEQDTNLANMRIVAFGTSKTWGAGLVDHNDNYVRLLSPEAVNLGLRATPADYPSLCLHSMIGDQNFDVVILEFSPNAGQHVDFERLVKRLRARFPTSMMIYLPIFMLLNDVDYQNSNLQSYLINSAKVPTPQDPSFVETIRSLNMADLRFPSPANVLERYRATMDAIGGYVIEFPKLQTDIKSLVIDNAKYYGNQQHPWDFVHPNELGHEFIAHKIRQKMIRVFAEEPIDHSATHQWVGRDQCVSWFLNGNVPHNDIQNIYNMTLNPFNPEESDGKWALEVDRMGGSFDVECAFAKCNVYVSYMAIGPNQDYPRVLLSINDQEPILVNPVLHRFHLSQIILAGTVHEPGMVTIHIKPIPEDIQSPMLFRVTGVIRTPLVDW